ncbi:site-2 protease family protein [Natrinema caseinilyticum]|uniref:site-2 protease family protein n=1 Tax=Natrinema caseinilyticum TaxID=2961570 RepID=UPI0020C4F8C9|nr:site-2 protease family protein [Natrinema caseinilyticum]
MTTSFTIGRIGGIPIRINISLIVFLPILVWLIGNGVNLGLYSGIIGSMVGAPVDTATLAQGATPWVIGTAASLGLFASVTIHELGHSVVARRYGVVIQSITLWIFGGVANMESIPKEWNQELRIAIAGPITSLLLGGLCFVVVNIIPVEFPVIIFVIGWLALMNVVLALFNLLPAFPMDGGRIFRAFLSQWLSYTQATHTAARVGELFALLFTIIGILSFNVILIFIALFVYVAAVSEYRTVALAELLEGLTAADVMERNPPTVSVDAPIDELVRQMIRERQLTFLVVENGRRAGTDIDIVGTITFDTLSRSRDHTTNTVGDVMAQDVPSVPADTAAMDVLMELWTSNFEHLLVERDGHPIGIVTPADVMEVSDLHKEAEIG